jgi:hypothetical protein
MKQHHLYRLLHTRTHAHKVRHVYSNVCICPLAKLDPSAVNIYGGRSQALAGPHY